MCSRVWTLLTVADEGAINDDETNDDAASDTTTSIRPLRRLTRALYGSLWRVASAQMNTCRYCDRGWLTKIAMIASSARIETDSMAMARTCHDVWPGHERLAVVGEGQGVG